MADHLATIFFDLQDLNLARLKTYAIFATSYLMRPLGAILFGHIGDKYGRKPAIISSLLLMALATFGIGILPTYTKIGILAPLLLIILRMLQGVAVAGELTGSAVLLTEYDNKKQQPFLSGAWTPCAAASGMLIGGVATTLVTAQWAPYWFWRIPFVLSAVIAFIAVYLRKSLTETPSFTLAKQNNKLFKSPMLAVYKYNKVGLLCTASFALFISVFVYTGNIYYKSMAIRIGNISPHTASTFSSYGMLLSALCMPIVAYIADRTNGLKICLSGLFLALILSPVMMLCAQSHELFIIFIGQIIYALINSMVSSTCFTILLNQFNTGTKYSGSSIAWSITTAIFGGSSLLVNELLITNNQFNGPGLYISLSALIAIVVLLFTNNVITRAHSVSLPVLIN